MVLREGTTAGTPALLAQEISFDDTMDRGWLELYTRGFIKRVETKVESGSSEGQTEKDWIKGTLTITVTDPAWISHLSVGNEFDSRSFDAASHFAPCAPVRCGKTRGCRPSCAPPRTARAPTAPSRLARAPSSGGPNKILKVVGIGCGALVLLTLFCLILGALVGK